MTVKLRGKGPYGLNYKAELAGPTDDPLNPDYEGFLKDLHSGTVLFVKFDYDTWPLRHFNLFVHLNGLNSALTELCNPPYRPPGKR